VRPLLDLTVGEAKNREALPLQPCVSPAVVEGAQVMNAAVDLDDQSR
jgi:hypothetical protein